MKKLLFLSLAFGTMFLIGNVADVSAQRSGSMVWRGTVDDEVELRIRRQNVQVTTLRGREYGEGNYDFDGSGMNRNSENVRVEKENGRGRVFIVQRPNRRNNWTTIIRIEDKKGGQDRYRVRVFWD